MSVSFVFLNKLFFRFLSLFTCGSPMMCMFFHLVVSHKFFKLSSLLKISFLFFWLDEFLLSSSLILFSNWSNLLLNLSVFQFSYYILQPCNFSLVILKCFLSFFCNSHCFCIAFLILVSIFMIVILNSLSGKSFICVIKIHFWRFILFFCLEHIPLCLHFPWLFAFFSTH